MLDKLKSEVNILKAQLKKRLDVKQSVYDESFELGLPNRRLSIDEKSFYKSEILTTLLDWCKVVCSFYNVSVDNFSVSFCDGRVLCLLVHHYYPELIPFNRIRSKTSLVHQQLELETSMDFLSLSSVEPDVFNSNERENFKLLSEGLKGLAEVPSMIFSADMMGTIPDEKVVITFVAYLCAALVDTSEEFRAARRIQRYWRKYRYLKNIDLMRKKRKAVIKLQAIMKGVLVRRQLVEMREHREKILQELRNTACEMIQKTYRSYVLMKPVRAEFLLLRNSAIKIQRFYRQRLAKKWKYKIIAATEIQRHYRGYVQRVKFAKMKSSVVVIQSFIRMVSCRRLFLAQKRAVETISDFWISRKKGLDQREIYLTMRKSVISLQCCYRSYRARGNVKRLRGILLFQRLARGHLARCRRDIIRDERDIKMKQIECATSIQKLWRGYRVRSDIQIAKESVVTIQRFYRSRLLAMYTRQKFMRIKTSAIRIQSVWKGYIVRKAIDKQSRSALLIQRCYQGFICRQRFLNLRRSVLNIQEAYRNYQIIKTERLLYLQQRQATVVIQSKWRGYQVRKSIKIKANSCVKIQSTWRMHIVRKEIKRIIDSTIFIQRSWRHYILRRRRKEEFELCLSATIKLQALYRGFKTREEIAQMHIKATFIQSFYRGYLVRAHQTMLNKYASLIQLRFRGYLETKRLRQKFTDIVLSVVIIQSWMRGHIVRKNHGIKLSAAVKIQSWYRMCCTRNSFLAQKNAVKFIEAHCIAFKEGRKQRRNYLQLKKTTTLLQAMIRGALVRRTLVVQTKAAVIIQSFYRMHAERQSYLRKLNAIIKIQSCWRMKMCRNNYYLIRKSVITIQSMFRMHRSKIRYQKQQSSALTVQRIWRGYSQRKLYQAKKQSAVMLQSLIRGYHLRYKVDVVQTLQEVSRRALFNSLGLSQVRIFNYCWDPNNVI